MADRPNHDRRYLIEPAKIETVLGWGPEIGFEEGLNATVDWYTANTSWSDRVFAAKGELGIDWSAALPSPTR